MATRRLASTIVGAPRPAISVKSFQKIDRSPGHTPIVRSGAGNWKSAPSRQKPPQRPLDTDTRLKVLFSRPSSSKTPALVDETTLLSIVRPVFENDRSRLDPFLSDISASLSPEKPKSSVRKPEVDSLVNDILAHCWIRSNELKSSRTPLQLYDIAYRYARRLVRQALEGSDARPVLTSLEESLRLYKPVNFMLPHVIFAAWAVLRHEASETASSIQFIPTKKEYVFKALHKLLGNQDEEFERYSQAVEDLVAANSAQSEELPDTPEQLDTMLAAMRIGQQTTEGVGLWAKYKEVMRSERSADHSVAGTVKISDDRVRSLASFLRFFSRSSVYRRLPTEERELAQYWNEVLSYLPRPYPPAIHHALLVHRARIDDEVKDATEARELDEQVLEFRDKAQVADDLDAVWRTAGEEGARDMKAYMLYMQGLAKVGDAEKLGMAWEDMVRDQACKEAYLREEGTDKSYPSTRMLNHMISCAFLIPNQGVEMALELFKQAVLPTSAIPIDIVTINTVLRHHARRGVVDAMIALFPLAEQRKLRPDVVTYTVLLQGLLRAREVRMAAKTLETMYKQGIPPNERTISLLISDLAKYGDRKGLRAAEELMKEMRALQMRVGEVPWTSLISGYFRGGWDIDAWASINRMELHGIKPNRVGYNMILRELGERVFSSSFPYTPMSPSPTSWTDPNSKSLLIEMFERMIGKVPPNSDTYLIVLTPLVRAQRWEEADQVVKEMKDRGFVAEKTALRVILRRIQQRKRLWD